MQKRYLFKERYYLEDFREHLISNQKSIRTIENYIDNVILFAEYFEQIDKEEFDPLIITKIDIVDYITHMQKEIKISVASINLRIQSLKAYYQYLFSAKLIAQDPLKNIKKLREVKVHEAKSFDEKTYRTIRRIIYRTGNPQHIAIWEVLTRAGLRVDELCNLTIDNLIMNLNTEDIRTGTLVIYGKGNIYREIPLHKDCRSSLASWIKVRNYKKIELPYIFISQRGKYTRSGINRILKKYYAMLGVEKNYSVHSCRHYFCRSLIRNGVDLSTVAKLAGHANAVITSQIYTVPNTEDMVNAIDRL